MMKKIISLALILAVLSAFCGCSEKKIFKCDNCGADVYAKADTNMKEEWIIYCGDCNSEIFGDGPVEKE